MRVDRCELFSGCYANATGLVAHQVLNVVAACDQHADVTGIPGTTVPPFAQYRGYEVPGVGEVTVMIGTAFERPDLGGDVSLFRMYLPNGTGVQGDYWPVDTAGDPAGEGSAWLLMSTLGASLSEVTDRAVSGPAKLVAEYAATQVTRIETEQHDRARVLHKAAPVGASVTVEAHRDAGWVRLYVESANGDVNHITHRVALLLGEEYCADRDAVRCDGPVLVSRLSLRLHGATGALFPRVKS